MTDYIAPLHIAVVRHGKLAGNRDIAFWTEAVRLQLLEAAKAWGLQPPGVFVYDAYDDGQGRRIPAGAAVIYLLDSDGDPRSLGFHGDLGGPYGVVDLAQSGDQASVVLSHEALELWGNAQLDRWVEGPEGLRYAVELCDPVEAVGYPVDVEVMGEKRTVMVSNFLLPAWFGQDLGDGRYDHLGLLSADHEIAPGGYAIATDGNGNIRYLAAEGGAMFPARKLRSTSRTARLIAKGRR